MPVPVIAPTAASATDLPNKAYVDTPTGGVEGVLAIANSGSTVTISLTTNTIFRYTLNANCTFTFPTAAAGRSFTVELAQDGTGSRTVTWPGTVRWAGGTTPTLTTTNSKKDIFTFLCTDGTNWYGFVAGQNFT
jgi:hypothetical protein